MYQKKIKIATLAFALSSGAAWAQPKAAKETVAQATAREAIVMQYERSAKAASRNDINGIMAILAPDFKSYRSDGVVKDRATYEQVQRLQIRLGMKALCTYKIQSIQWRGPDAIVVVHNRSVGTLQGKKFDLKTTSRDYWSPSPTGWKIRQAVHTQMQGFVNGRAIKE